MKNCSATTEELNQSHIDPKEAVYAAIFVIYLLHKLFLYFSS